MSERQPLTEPIGEGVDRLTDAGREYIAELVTNVDGDVFAWTEKADRHMVATQNMRKSRSKNDGRVIAAKEFSGGEDKDLQVAFRVSQEFGDDSVQQLYSVDVDITGLSQLATKQVEWHRPGIGYLEKSTRYVPYDEKDENGRFKYVTPHNLGSEETEVYRHQTDSIFSLYSEAVIKLASHIRARTPKDKDIPDKIYDNVVRAKALDEARIILPASTKTIVGIHGTAQAINNLILRLCSSDIPEAAQIGTDVLEEVRKLSPVFFERTAWPHRGGKQIEYYRKTRAEIQDFISEYLPEKPTEWTEGQVVELRRYTPEDEFELLPYMLFDEAPAAYSLEDIESIVSQLSLEEKIDLMKTYIGRPTNRRHRPGRALEQANYTWELLSDFGAFRDLQRHRMVDDLRWQRLTVEHGFDVSEVVRDAGLEDLYTHARSISEDLFSYLNEKGFPVEAQYATLLGHKLRWTMKTNGRSNNHILQLRSTPAGHSSYRKTVQLMYQAVEKVHPHLAQLSMPFMNQNEDPALGRLDQEMALYHKQNLQRD